MIRYLHRNLERHPARCLFLVSLLFLTMGLPALLNAALQWLCDRLRAPRARLPKVTA